jgi:hypothetical protein
MVDFLPAVDGQEEVKVPLTRQPFLYSTRHGSRRAV